jgi:hypothetical protein
MEIKNTIYFRCKKGITRFYSINLFTEDTKIIDIILDQLGMAVDNLNLAYINKEEFDKNMRIPLKTDIRDSENDDVLIGNIIFDAVE